MPDTLLDGQDPVYTGPRVGFNVANLDYGDLTNATNTDTDLRVYNVGDEDLIVTSITSSSARVTFPTLTLPFTVAPGANQLVVVRATPNALGLISFTLTVVSNSPGNPDTLNGSFTGVVAGTVALTVDPPSQEFPNTAVGAVSSEILFTVSNTGTVNVQVNAYTFPADFVVGATNPALPQVIVPGGSYQFGIVFDPVSEGFVTQQVQVTSTAAASPFLIEVIGQAYLITPAYILTNTVGAIIYALASNTSVVAVKKSVDPIVFDTEETCLVQKLHNYSQLGVDKTTKWFWFHYQDKGVATVVITISNQSTGATESYTRSIGSVSANERRLLDIFEVTMSGEDVLISWQRTSGTGPLFVEDYGVKFLPFEEQLGTSANSLTITPAYTASGSEELLFAFGNASLQKMDPDNFACETTATIGNTIMLPFPTEKGQIPGFTYEKQIMRVFFHYEYLAAATVRIQLTSMRGLVSYQDVVLVAAAAGIDVQNGVADINIVDEICKIEFIPQSGPVQIVDYTCKYEIKGERGK